MAKKAMLLGLWPSWSDAKAVFAHFMVDNTFGWTQRQWTSEIALALSSRLDGFALNVAAGNTFYEDQLTNAFSAANSFGFKLFFSFDYTSNGPWAKEDVISLLSTYGNHISHYKHGENHWHPRLREQKTLRIGYISK